MNSSRRKFLKGVLAAPIAVTVGDGLVAKALLASPDHMVFSRPDLIRYDSECFTIRGKDTFIFGAVFHYSRCPQAQWADRLAKLKAAGFNTIECYAFWNYHEPVEGQVNLTRFEEFIELVHKMGFYMIARPGPYVCAEWHRGGFPDWVAAMRFPLRSDNPESIKTSRHWYDLVLPVIRRHQITRGGPIILMQIENEYDSSVPMPMPGKIAYIEALAKMAWAEGIDVPLITCKTKESRDNYLPVMAKIMDTYNFYPFWDIVKRVEPKLRQLREQEPDCPLAVTELQGGWFSQFGGKLSIDQKGIGPEQLDTLTKTVLEQGVVSFNYYMGGGGTNFDWAGKNLTTTYDYAAPLREPGGTWEKYFRARGIGRLIHHFGDVLIRAHALKGGASSNSPSISVTERVNGRSGMIFVRENADTDQHFKLKFHDPASSSHRGISVPRQGELALGPREMKMLPVQVPISGGWLRYTTAEVLDFGQNADRHFLILYDVPGRVAEFALEAAAKPRVEGETLYQHWDSSSKSVVIGIRFEETRKQLLVNGCLAVILLPRDLALRTWVAQFPSRVLPRAAHNKSLAVPLITDTYLLTGSGLRAGRMWAELEFLPGEHELALLLPRKPSQCIVDGVAVHSSYDERQRMASLHLTTPALPYEAIPLSRGECWVERFNPESGGWKRSTLKPLEDEGPDPYGYVKYMTRFTHSSQKKMFIDAYTDDGKKVFINGQYVAEASTKARKVEFELAKKYAKPGANTLEIAYESFGALNGHKEMGDLKGVRSVSIGRSPQSGTPVGSWEIQRFPAPMNGRKLNQDFEPQALRKAVFQTTGLSQKLIPAFTWCRSGFVLPKVASAWEVPWKLTFKADRDALIFLNGKFIGRYVIIGPQAEFYLPEAYLETGGKKNLMTFVLAYTDRPEHLRRLEVGPYHEFSARRTRVEFDL